MPGEFDLIGKYFQPLSGEGSFDLKDDVAFLEEEKLIVTKDVLVGGVHFFLDDQPELIARKVLRVNISDIVSKGARPVSYMLGCVLPEHIDEGWLHSFTRGLAEDQAEYGLDLLGGDTTRSYTGDTLLLSVTMFGRPEPSPWPVMRRGAKSGDSIFVSGTIGDAGLGLLVRDNKLSLHTSDELFLQHRYLCPEPRLHLAKAVAQYASASMDVSDGLIADVGHLANTSSVHIDLHADLLPLSQSAQNWLVDQADKLTALTWLATAGDDYEILCTVPQDKCTAFKEAAKKTNIPVTKIGECRNRESKPVLWLDDQGGEISVVSAGYDHFDRS